MSRRSQGGNVFFALLAAVGLVGVLGASLTTFITGPAATMVTVTNKSKADTQMQIATRLAVVEAVHQGSGGDCDDDGTIEPLPPQDAGGSPAPLGGGHLPAALGAAQLDPWGTPYGYCAWNHGALNADNGCSANLLAGTNYPDARTRTALAIISAGPDRRFDTMCGPHPVYVDRNGDDLVMAYTYAEAIEASGGLWVLKSGEPTTATIDRDVEVQGAFRMGLAGEDPGFVGTSACLGPQHINRMRYNSFDQTIEVCTHEDSDYQWKGISGASDGACEAGPVGTQCPDGTYYIGKSPADGMPVFMTSSDYDVTRRYDNADCYRCGDGTIATSTKDGRLNVWGMLNWTEGNTAAGDLNGFDAARYCHCLGKPASGICHDGPGEASGHGHSDWYLPAGGGHQANPGEPGFDPDTEQNLFWEMVVAVGDSVDGIGTSSADYYSSTEAHGNNAKYQRFSTGRQYSNLTGKNNVRRVRCVRRDAQLWQRSETNPDNIFYSGGNVGIGGDSGLYPIMDIASLTVAGEVAGGYFAANNPDGDATAASGVAGAPEGTAYGAHFVANSPEGAGVFGVGTGGAAGGRFAALAGC